MNDVAIVGSGPGGYVAAIRAAQLGLKTVCIEKSETFGGTCLNVGCIPSKCLLQSSEHFAFLKHQAKEHGIGLKGISLELETMMNRKKEVVKGLGNGVTSLFKKNKIETIRGTACFKSKEIISVNGEDVQAKNFILATGSCPIELPFLKFDEKKVLSSTGALSLKTLPKKMLVIGAGVIGVELASIYSRLGSEVIIIEMLEKICPAMDGTISDSLLQVLKAQGIQFYLGAQVQEAKVSKEEVTLKVKTPEGLKNFSGDVVLVSVGRRPFTEGLGLEMAGVEKNNKGYVSVDDCFRSSQKHIYAIGDMIEGPMLAHRASEEGVAVAEWIAGQSSKVNYVAIPNVIYTQPEAASVGYTEEEVKSAGIKYITGMCSFKGNARARCFGDNAGCVKIIGTALGKLIGLHIIGPHASEMIGMGALAIDRGATIEELASLCYAHPSLSESIKEAALNALGRSIHS